MMDDKSAFVVATHVSPGGIPKRPVAQVQVTVDGFVGDGRAHAKHLKTSRAISLIDEEILEEFCAEGYDVGPGLMGENITVRGLHVQGLTPGMRLCFSGGVELELTEPRKPCLMLDAIHPELKTVSIGRIGYMARVVRSGVLRPGEKIVRRSMFSGQLPHVQTGAVLAGGLSRRMGTPKEAVLLWDGRPMIEHVIATLSAVCQQVVIVGACQGYPIKVESGIIHLLDRHPGSGPLAGIEALLSSGLDDAYLIVACDQPLLTPSVLRRFLDGDKTTAKFFTDRDGERFDPFPGYFPTSMLPQVRESLHYGDRSVEGVVKGSPVRWVSISDSQRIGIKNMNTPKDLAEALVY